MPRQIGADLTLFEIVEHDTIYTSRQHSREICLAHRQRELADIVIIGDEQIKGIELNRLVMLARVQTIDIDDAVDTERHRFASPL